MITKTPGVCGGAPRIHGTRIPVWLIARQFLEGASIENILLSYPSLKSSDIDDALRYSFRQSNAIKSQIAANSIA